MAYLDGDLGLDVGKTFNEIRADAFQYLSKAAEGLGPGDDPDGHDARLRLRK